MIRVHCDLFIIDSSEDTGGWDVSLQIPFVAIGLHATSLSFLQKLLEFFRETLNNPVYRDEKIGPGHYRHMPDKSCDLSDCFDIPVSIRKDGEFDDRYFVHLSLNPEDGISLVLSGEEMVHALEDALEDAIEDWL